MLRSVAVHSRSSSKKAKHSRRHGQSARPNRTDPDGPVSMSQSDENENENAQDADLKTAEFIGSDFDWSESDAVNTPRTADARKAETGDVTPFDDTSDADSTNRYHLPLSDDTLCSDDEPMTAQKVKAKGRYSRKSHGTDDVSAQTAETATRTRTKHSRGMANEERKEDGDGNVECSSCRSHQSKLNQLRGVHAAQLDMGRLMELERELITSLQRVQSAIAQKYENEKLCVVCRRFNKNTVFQPCGHFSSCDECAEHLEKCPICMQSIGQKFKVYQ